MSNNNAPTFVPESELAAFKKQHKIWKEVDIVKSQLAELNEIRNPGKPGKIAKTQSERVAACWVYFPWSGVLLHCLNDDELFEIRTNRNRNLISPNEQNKLNQCIVGVAGMSVGAGIALGSIYSGISKQIKLADFDTLETANLNRVRETLSHVGEKKIDLVAQSIYEINPFASIYVFDEGLNDKNIDTFFREPKLDIVIDEIDDFKMKVLLRVKAKEHKIPLLMFTSLGDNILIDVERYDLNPEQEIFNGAIGNVAEEILSKETISPDDIRRYSVQLVGAEYIPTKALESLTEMGKTLVGRPQLYSTIAVDGGLAAYVIRQILLGGKVKSDRHFVKFAELFGESSDDLALDTARKEVLAKLMGQKS